MISILIIIPTLDSYQYLSPLVKTLQEQTFTNWRVIFIDGNSSHRHREWLDQLCEEDRRFAWQEQLVYYHGIYGAMNQGFTLADPVNDWILFWGSDDRAASPSSLEKMVKELEDLFACNQIPDLYICRGRYFSSNPIYSSISNITRESKFSIRESFAKSLFFGFTPPHQATLIGPKARQKLNYYDTNYLLAADLDYFLRISLFRDLNVFVADYNLVMMGNSGISSKQSRRRFHEVQMAYEHRFGVNWWIPFILRYMKRALSALGV